MRCLRLAALLLAASASLLAAEEGLASWYGGKFQGRRTASGELFDTRQLTAAHKSLPFGTLVLVTNLENGRSVTVRINDRGPFVPGRVIDLSLAAAAAIGLAGRGVAPVRLEVAGGPPAAAAGAPPATAAATAAGAAPTTAAAIAAGAAPAAAPAPPTGYCLQFGAFRQRANAERCLARLEAAGFDGELEQAEGGILRVVIPGVTASELPGLRARLSAAGWTALVRARP